MSQAFMKYRLINSICSGTVKCTDMRIIYQYEDLYWIAYQMAKDSGEVCVISEWRYRN